MAGFKTHISTSSLIGVGYGAAGHLLLGAPLTTSIVAGGLCGLSGMLPDLDSDSGVPLRETISFSAAVVPLLMLDRFQQLGLNTEAMVLVGGAIYFFVRFGVAGFFKRYTVHRGMWHSIPAAMSVGLLAFLIVSCDDMTLRIFKSAAVVLGFMSHLLLDEWYSIQWRFGVPRFKKSFGTALKFWSKNAWANVSTYGKLALLVVLALGDPVLMQKFEYQEPAASRTARQILDNVVQPDEPMLR